MKKQYMDFVPSKSVKSVGRTNSSVPIVKNEPVRVVTKTTRVVRPTMRPTRISETAKVPRSVESQRVQPHTAPVRFSQEKQPVLGIVEDLSPKFVKTDVPKRPLGQKGHFSQEKTGVKAVKARPVGMRVETKAKKPDVKKKSVEKPVEKVAKKPVEKTYRPPKAQFINQDKVVKRPLSKNVYVQKEEKILKEQPQGPVTIISKPEKQAHVGMIITIIITIILGAAAGTIAFLLLPK